MTLLSLIPAQYRLIATITLLAAFIGGVYAYAYHAGYKRATDAASAEKLKSVERAIEQAAAIAKQDNEIAAAALVATEKTRTITRTIIQKVRENAKINPINCNLGAERMRLIKAAIDNQEPADSGQPDYSLPAATLSGK